MEHRFSEPAEVESRQPEPTLRPGRLTMAANVIRLTTTAIQLAALVLCAVAVGTPRWFLITVAGVDLLSVGLFQSCDLVQNSGCSMPDQRNPKPWIRAVVSLGLLGLILSVLGLVVALFNAHLARKGRKSPPVKCLCLVAAVLTVASLIACLSLYGSNVDAEIKMFGLVPFIRVSHRLGYSSILLIVSIILHAIVALGHLFDIITAHK